LARNPGFTAVAVIALALGIGANTAIFSVVNGVLLQPLPYRDPDHLMRLSETSPDFGTMSVACPNFVDWRDQNRSFTGLASFRWEDYDVTGSDRPEHLSGKMVSADFFRVLESAQCLARLTPGRPLRRFARGPHQWSLWADASVTRVPATNSSLQRRVMPSRRGSRRFSTGRYRRRLHSTWNSGMTCGGSRNASGIIMSWGETHASLTQAQSEAAIAPAWPHPVEIEHKRRPSPRRWRVIVRTYAHAAGAAGRGGFRILIACANVANLIRPVPERQKAAVRAAVAPAEAGGTPFVTEVCCWHSRGA
jgi:hypothetical protein